MNKAREPLYKKRRELWKEVVFDLRGGEGEKVAQQRLQMLESWRNDHWGFLAAKDVDGEPIIRTVDERDEAKPIKPFPSEKEYLRDISEELWRYRIVLIDKIRQRYITTLCALEIFWFCAFREEREVFVSRVTEDSAVKLINDKIRKTHSFMPLWVREALPIDKQPAKMISFLETGSTVTGVAQNFGSGGARGPTASLVMVDEAAFQDQYGEIFGAVMPMASRLWAVSTANIGNEGAKAFKAQIFDSRPGYKSGEEETGDEMASDS